MVMAFIQLMEFTTSKMDQVNELFEEWLKATEAESLIRRRPTGLPKSVANSEHSTLVNTSSN